MPYVKKGRRSPEQRFWRKVEKTDDCWLWTGICGAGGYGRFYIEAGKRLRAHRFSYELANGPIPDGLAVCHSCDNPRCVNPEHLFIGTNKDNVADRTRKGRGTQGERIPQSKLTAEQVNEIRRSYVPGVVSLSMLGKKYGVSDSCIAKIIRRVNWKDQEVGNA